MQRFLVRAVKWYQGAFAWRTSPCRFEPSCSNYSLEALETFGAFKGTLLTIRRLCRCVPFGPSGYDPIPEKKERSGARVHL